jgi:hypothetical protein
MNNMGREIMAALKRFQVGSDGDGVTVGGALVVSGATTANTFSATAVNATGTVTFSGSVILSGTTTANTFSTDLITEKTSAAGVTIDSVLLKDNKVTANELTINSNNISADNSLGFRNRIINGDMRIDQRNAGAAITTSGFLVDRWTVTNSSDGAFSAQQDSSAPVGFTKSIKWTTTTADASLAATQYAIIRQGIEGFNMADLGWGSANAKSITISFWVRSSLTGTFGASMHNADFNRSYPFTYTISTADTWEQKSVTIAGDTSGTWNTTNGVGIQLYFGLGVGSTFSGTAGAWAASGLLSATGAVSVIGTLNATWYVTGVQLEVGSVATPFERRPYGTELALCQRYFEKSYNQSVVPGTASVGTGASGFATSTTNGYNYGVVRFAVSKRAAPTITTYSFAGNAGVASDGNGTNLTANSAGTNSIGETGYNINNASGGTLTFTGNSYFVNWIASAEL